MTTTQLQPLTFSAVFFGILFTVLPILFIHQGNRSAAVLFIIALIVFSKRGIEINARRNTYRDIRSIFGVNIGLWKKLPAIQYISVFKTTQKSRIRVITAEAIGKFPVYKINLFYKGNKHLEVYVAETSEEAFDVANTLSQFLEAPVHDATNE